MDLFNNTNTSQAGFRLQYLEVYNWGTFNKVRWNIAPNGNNALLTGDIGSGKSTLVDALTCLLVPHNKIVFNKAAGAEGKERNLLSYVRGEFKKEKEEITKLAKKVYLRPDDNTYTVIIGNFKNEAYEENVCLAQFFWIGKEGKVDKSLIISPVPLTVKEHFSSATDINDLKKRLRSINGIQFFNENFTQYSETFRRLFGMNSEKAIDLFYQTVSMKSVSSLTDFVRDQMLEKTDVKEQISALLKRFDDLNKAHAAVVHAREQHQILKPLTEDCADYEKLNVDIEEIEAMLEVLPAWFARRKLELLEVAISDTNAELEKGLQSQNRTSAELNELENRRSALIHDIAQNGGSRVEQIAVEINRHEQDKDARKKEFDEYEELIAQAGLKPVQKESDFDENSRQAFEMDEQCTVLQTTLREQRDSLKSELTKQESEYQLEYQELKSLKARKTQIPDWLVRFRAQLCIDLRLAESELPFVGELIKVNEQESTWEGAIERLLHDAGISLLVPRNHYKSVSKYVNDNPLRGADGKGIKLTYLEADLHGSRLIKELDNESVVHKIDIKPDSNFGDWLEDYLRRSFGDYICTDVNGLQHVPFGLTPQGLIKTGRIRHIKDDRRRIDDIRNYVLGWSNVEKIRALEASVTRLKQRVDQLDSEIKTIEDEERGNQNSKLVLDRILQFKEFSRIDWQYHVQKIYELNKERHELMNNNDVLAGLQRSKEEVEQLISRTKVKERELTEKIGALKNDIKNFEEQKVRASNQSGQFDTSKYQKWYPVLDEKLAGQKLSLKNIEARQEEFRKQYEGDTGELKKLRFKLSSSRSAIEKRMRQIREHSRAEFSEVAESIDARSEYITKYKQLVSEDLKRHEERFKEELNKNVIQSIAVFDNKLRKHEDEIRRKISSINQHLAEIDYNATQSTFITILMESAASKEVRQFREDLKACYKNTLGNPDEIYSEDKYEQVKRILDRFASMENVDKEWTSSVTDVRQWFEFNASERYRLDNTEKEFYEGSGGKSGGQKEKLAYTILASALAYQFGLQFGESKSKSFRFVVIDEAFGRGSDESTRYGLELFKKLNLQLLIVTPLQKIHVIENHVNSFHFVSNREGNNSQVSNFTKDEYEMEKQKHHLIKASLLDDQS